MTIPELIAALTEVKAIHHDAYVSITDGNYLDVWVGDTPIGDIDMRTGKFEMYTEVYAE